MHTGSHANFIAVITYLIVLITYLVALITYSVSWNLNHSFIVSWLLRAYWCSGVHILKISLVPRLLEKWPYNFYEFKPEEVRQGQKVIN